MKTQAQMPVNWDLILVFLIVGGVTIASCGLLGALILVAIGWTTTAGIVTSTIIASMGVLAVAVLLHIRKVLRP